MSWEKDPLWAKSKLFFAHAFEFDRDDPRFGLWCALGLEMLARTAIASVSPTLLAEPDREHTQLLHALGRGSDSKTRKSISINQVLSLCNTLFSQFTADDFSSSMALFNRRNAELHTGEAAFEEYTTQQWIAGFYKTCRSLCEAMDESLESLFGSDEASVADQTLAKTEQEVIQKVQSNIAAHRRVFEGLSEEERKVANDEASKSADRFSYRRHHKVICPACNSAATVQGTEFGEENIKHLDNEIVVRRAVVPNQFSCTACKLKLDGYPDLSAAKLGDQYTRRSTYTPEEYYGMIDPQDDFAVAEFVRDNRHHLEEYDNE